MVVQVAMMIAEHVEENLKETVDGEVETAGDGGVGTAVSGGVMSGRSSSLEPVSGAAGNKLSILKR